MKGFGFISVFILKISGNESLAAFSSEWLRGGARKSAMMETVHTLIKWRKLALATHITEDLNNLVEDTEKPKTVCIVVLNFVISVSFQLLFFTFSKFESVEQMALGVSCTLSNTRWITPRGPPPSPPTTYYKSQSW